MDESMNSNPCSFEHLALNYSASPTFYWF